MYLCLTGEIPCFFIWYLVTSFTQTDDKSLTMLRGTVWEIEENGWQNHLGSNWKTKQIDGSYLFSFFFLPTWPRLALNLRLTLNSACFCLSSAGITGVNQHTLFGIDNFYTIGTVSISYCWKVCHYLISQLIFSSRTILILVYILN
jgi:hypothetical protein